MCQALSKLERNECYVWFLTMDSCDHRGLLFFCIPT